MVQAQRYLTLCVSFAGLLLVGCATNDSLSSANSPQIFVNASGYGATHSSALQDAFKNAVQQASGVFLISSARLENEVLTKDITNEYSTGIISRYEMLSESIESNGAYRVQIGALVSSNKLFNYVISNDKGSKANAADGAQLYAQLSSGLKSKRHGDRLLASLATQYPYPAVSIQLGKLSSKIDASRQPILSVPYQIQWNKEYLESFREVVDYVSTYKCTVVNSINNRCTYDIVFSNGFWSFGARTGYTLTDKVQLELMRRRFNSKLGVRLDFYDKSGQIINTACTGINLATNWSQSISSSGTVNPSFVPLVHFDGASLEVNDVKINGMLDLSIGEISWVDRISKIKAKLVQTCRV